EFLDVERDRREVQAEVAITLDGDARLPSETHRQRINLLSMSARGDLRSELNAIYGTPSRDPAWARILARGFGKAHVLFEEVDRAVRASEMAPPPALPYVVGGFAPAGGPTILFGSSSAGKTMLALSLAIAVARGAPW